ncbi:Annexin [Pholiota conissans]|uniref:Annexin n=1 Tax=Pholiota conissans TaxID=109636 RepID=A0A9P6D0R4_9AGAR|nr:Annexin [Pholiota conissans]
MRAPPAGAPPTGAPTGQPPYGSPGAPTPYAAPGQYPYPYGAYAPPQGAPGYYPPPPAPGQYYPAPGQYPYPGYYPPPGQYPPPPGQYPPPPGQYTPPAGPASGAQATPTGSAAAATPGATPAAAGAQAQYTPPAGAPPAGQYPPPPGAPYGIPQQPYGSPYAMPGFPPGGAPYGAYPPPPAPMHHADPLVYLGTAIPDPSAPPAPQGVQKVPGYDPSHDYIEILQATSGDIANETKRQSSSLSPLSVASPAKRSLSVSSVYSNHSANSESMPMPDIYPKPKTNSRPSAMTSAFNSLTSRTANMLTLETKYAVAVLKVLTRLNVFQMDALNDFFTGKLGVTLTDRIERTTTGNFSYAARLLTLGPLGADVDLIRKALAGFGTNEILLIELVLGRPGHELRWLKTGYKLRYGKDLVDAVKSDLSGKIERMFIMALNTQKPVDSPYNPIDHARVAADVEELHKASKKKEEQPFFEILINRSDQHISAVIALFGTQYKSLSKVIKKTFSGTIEQGLLHIMHGVKPKRDQQGIWRDAKMLEKSMAGLGTKDQQLVYRLIRAHWNPSRFEAVKDAYKRRYGKALENRVKGETSGTYRDMLVAILRSSEV